MVSVFWGSWKDFLLGNGIQLIDIIFVMRVPW